MNVLLAEADVPYDKLEEMDDINPRSRRSTLPRHRRQRRGQPGGAHRPEQPHRRHADHRRGQGAHGGRGQAHAEPGFAGIPNPLFAADNTLMIFGDGKKAMTELVQALKEG